MDELQQLFNSSSNWMIAGHCAEPAKRIVTEVRSYGIPIFLHDPEAILFGQDVKAVGMISP